MSDVRIAEWSEERCLVLIEAYKDCSILWNPKDKDYYKKHLKGDAWVRIGAIMDEPADVCKQKMINILASYRRERMKVKKSIGTGKGKNEIYDSKWYTFNVLNFLDDRFTPRKGLEAGGSTEQTEDLDVSSNNDSDAASPEPLGKKQKVDPKLQMLKEAFGILKNSAKPQQDTELRCFFDFVLEKMKNYTRDTKNVIQHEIFQMIMRADQGYYNSIPNYGYYSTTQNQPTPRSTSSTSTAANEEVSYTDLNIARPSSSSSAQNQQIPPPFSSPGGNSSNYSPSQDMNFEDYV